MAEARDQATHAERKAHEAACQAQLDATKVAVLKGQLDEALGWEHLEKMKKISEPRLEKRYEAMVFEVVALRQAMAEKHKEMETLRRHNTLTGFLVSRFWSWAHTGMVMIRRRFNGAYKAKASEGLEDMIGKAKAGMGEPIGSDLLFLLLIHYLKCLGVKGISILIEALMDNGTRYATIK